MVIPPKSQTEAQSQKAKLVSSYNALLEEFSSNDLRTVGNYSVGALIGKGSFGKVYLASHKLINRSKVVLKSADKNDQNLAREIHHHRQFRHPHIARLYEVIVTEQLVWLVLEYCPGDELYYYLTKHGPIEPEKVQKIFTQLVGAVSYVHQKSCVHRDLKLENILLDKNEDVKLCDFGFTREYEGKSSYLQTWCGTVCYSAPEMLKGEKYAAEKVDVWSLGVILYALLCGELPFDEDDDDKTKMKILKEEPKYPDTLPMQARDLINNMLSKRPLLRPSLADILTNPWLIDYAPQQQAYLKLQHPAPFSTQLETETLQRMRSAGVNIDAVIENVLSQRCDALAGWWALLLEKEERKEQRRQRRRKERDIDAKVSRRISAASGRVLGAPTIREERSREHLGDALPEQRGRSPQRANGSADAPAASGEADQTQYSPQAKTGSLPRPHEYRTYRPASSSRPRRKSQLSLLGPGVPASKRNSMLQVVSTNEAPITQPESQGKKRKRKYPPFMMAQIASIKSWFKDPSRKLTKAQSSPSLNAGHQPRGLLKPQANDLQRISTDTGAEDRADTRPDLIQRATYPPRPRVSTQRKSTSRTRMASQSPSPLTPRSSYRRSTGSNLRGRKSTSSSVSSVRSFATNIPNSGHPTTTPAHSHHHASHSKASSVSSNSIGSPSSLNVPAKQQKQHRRRSSPSTAVSSSSFVKVLPNPHHASPLIYTDISQPLTQLSDAGNTTSPSPAPGTSAAMGRTKRIPPSINLPSSLNTNTEANAGHLGSPSPSNPFAGLGPPSPGLPIFARRKRTPFRGPQLLGPGRRRGEAMASTAISEESPPPPPDTSEMGTQGSRIRSSDPRSSNGQPQTQTQTQGQPHFHPTTVIEEDEELEDDGFEDIETADLGNGSGFSPGEVAALDGASGEAPAYFARQQQYTTPHPHPHTIQGRYQGAGWSGSGLSTKHGSVTNMEASQGAATWPGAGGTTSSGAMSGPMNIPSLRESPEFNSEKSFYRKGSAGPGQVVDPDVDPDEGVAGVRGVHGDDGRGASELEGKQLEKREVTQTQTQGTGTGSGRRRWDDGPGEGVLTKWEVEG